MTIGNVSSYILRRTGTVAGDWGTTYADMAIVVNSALERVESIIRKYIATYDSTRFTGSDISTGTATIKFDSRYHELLGLWPVYQFFVDHNLPGVSAIREEIELKESALGRFYELRNYLEFTVTIASPGVFTLDKHKFVSGDMVIFETTGALPTGLSANTWYFIISAGLDNDNFEVSATRDGTAINTSGTQSGTHFISVKRQPGLRSAYEDNR